MSRKRNNEDELVENLEQEVKELKSIVRHLQKELKKSNKAYKETKYIVDDEPNKAVLSKTCPECFRGHLKEVVLGSVRMFIKCSDCDYRTKTVKINK